MKFQLYTSFIICLSSCFLLCRCGSDTPDCHEVKTINFTVDNKGENVLFYDNDFYDEEFNADESNPKYSISLEEGSTVTIKDLTPSDSICRREWYIYRWGAESEDYEKVSEEAEFNFTFNEIGRFEVRVRINNSIRSKLVQVGVNDSSLANDEIEVVESNDNNEPNDNDSNYNTPNVPEKNREKPIPPVIEDKKPSIVIEDEPEDEKVEKSKQPIVEEKTPEPVKESPINTTPISEPQKPSDSDNDGIPDDEDNCPNEAGPAPLDGCPDSDNDGIADVKDQCPDQKGIKAYNGCPPPPPKPPIKKAVQPSEDADWFPVKNGATGIRSRDRCSTGSSDTKYVNSGLNINFSPTEKMMLSRASVWASDNGKVKFEISYNSNSETKKASIIKRVNLGKSNIELTDLDVIMQPGRTYTLIITPMKSANSTLKLESISDCPEKTASTGNTDLKIDYKNNFVLFDLKYGY